MPGMTMLRGCFAASLLAVAACGGNDFEAAATGDAGAMAIDSYEPPDRGMTAHDAPASDEMVTPNSDATGESHGDDGVTDANGERVVDDASMADTPADTRADAPTDTTADVLPDATCDAPSFFYRDRDRDGYGSTDNRISACVAPAGDDGGTWVAQPGDCRDDLYEVKPFKMGATDPPKYSGTGYPDPVRPRGISFDYDCNGDETADPTNQFGGAPTCPALVTGCTGTGYLPATPARNGTGVNPLCGSTMLKTCVVQGLNCVEQYIQMATPFRCR